MKYFLFASALLFLACKSDKAIELEMPTDKIIELIGKADSTQKLDAIPDVYTNKLIRMELWYYGNDTTLRIANNKLKNISIN